jgi:signal peptidase I
VIRATKIIVLVGLVVSLLSLAFQIVVVPTASMEGTVLVGDHLLIDRFAYGPEIAFGHLRLPRLKKVQRGDVVSFHPPGRAGEVYLKRVVAVGGDRVESRDGVLYINGEPRLEKRARFEMWPAGAQQLVVAPGQLYVLGDNRDHSEDSRKFGTVPEVNVIGEPVMVLWSFANPTREWLRSEIAVYFDHPVAHLRWERFFQKVQ